MKWVLNAFLNLCCLLSAILFVYSIFLQAEYLKFTNQMIERMDPIKKFGLVKISCIFTLLLISPIYTATEYELYTKESFFDGTTWLYYGW